MEQQKGLFEELQKEQHPYWDNVVSQWDGGKIDYKPISQKGNHRLHQSGKTVVLGIFMGFALHTGVDGRMTCLSWTWR